MQHTCCRSTAQRPLVSESTTARCATTSALTRTDLKSMKLCTQVGYCVIVMPLPWGGALSDTAIRPSVPWRSCLGYGHAGCLQLSYHQRCADCGPNHGRVWIRHNFCHCQTAIGGEEAYRLAVPGAIPCWIN